MRVMVVGGAGYIGSVVVEELLKNGHAVAVVDNLSMGHAESVPSGVELIQADLLEKDLVQKTMELQRTEAVVHLAASALVGESVGNPSYYYRNNVTAGLSLLEAMQGAGVKRIVFSSTAATYGEPQKQPIEESDPTNPCNPYGETKLAFERALRWHNVQSVVLRYFNAAGATERCGEQHDPETHLIPIVLRVAAGRAPHVEIFGEDYPTRDGTCVRDYIHVIDLAKAHVLALQSSVERGTYNLGCGGDGYTVKEVVAAAKKITGREIPVRMGPRRAGDPAVLIASAEKAKRELGWKPEMQSLESIIGSAWKWMESRR